MVIVCSDRTDTLTQNQLTMIKFLVNIIEYDSGLNEEVKKVFLQAISAIPPNETESLKYVESSSECVTIF